jgi:hypothetical protein
MMESKKFLLQDGGEITASCASDFVMKLREGSRFDSECTDTEYMTSFVDRFLQMSGFVIRADSPEHFLEDLIKYDYAKQG